MVLICNNSTRVISCCQINQKNLAEKRENIIFILLCFNLLLDENMLPQNGSRRGLGTRG